MRPLTSLPFSNEDIKMHLKRWHRAIGAFIAGMLSELAVLIIILKTFPSFGDTLLELDLASRLIIGIPMMFISLWMLNQFCRYRWARLPFEYKGKNYGYTKEELESCL